MKLNAPIEDTHPAAVRWTQTSSSAVPPFKVLDLFPLVELESGGAFRMYHHLLDELLLCSHVDDFLFAASVRALLNGFTFIMGCITKANPALWYFCWKMTLSVIVLLVVFISEATLIVRLLEQEISDIMRRENLTSDGHRYNPSKELNK